MTSPESSESSAPSVFAPKRVAIQLVGFVIGIGLLAWCIHGAWPKNDEEMEGWTRLRDAPPLLLAGLLGLTALSALINGSMFAVSVKPLRPLPAWDLQRLNLLGNLLNYAPIRLGAAMRVVYHMRIDGLTLLQVGAWFATIAGVLIVSVVAFFGALMITEGVNVMWGVIAASGLIAGTVLVSIIASRVFSRPEFSGAGVIARSGRTMSAIALLRTADIAVFVLRMTLAARILGLDLTPARLIALGIVAFASSLVPFGRIGFREAAVAATAMWLGMEEGDVAGRMAQLALLDSAGEVLFYVPAGAIFLPWLRTRFARAGTRGDQNGAVTDGDSGVA